MPQGWCASVRCQGQGSRPMPEIFQRRQGARVDHAVAANLHGHVITAVLALAADLLGDPPGYRMIEQQRLQDHLQRIDEVVVPANMGELVR